MVYIITIIMFLAIILLLFKTMFCRLVSVSFFSFSQKGKVPVFIYHRNRAAKLYLRALGFLLSPLTTRRVILGAFYPASTQSL
jgi:hypothetical protein